MIFLDFSSLLLHAISIDLRSFFFFQTNNLLYSRTERLLAGLRTESKAIILFIICSQDYLYLQNLIMNSQIFCFGSLFFASNTPEICVVGLSREIQRRIENSRFLVGCFRVGQLRFRREIRQSFVVLFTTNFYFCRFESVASILANNFRIFKNTRKMNFNFHFASVLSS